MAKKGILVDMNYCTGCHACEVACKQENGFPVGVWGIKITEMLMRNPNDERVWFDYVPYFSPNCTLCASRIASGEDDKPSCAKHCGTGSIYYGDISELAKRLETMPRGILYSPK